MIVELGNEMKHALREILVGITFAVVISMPFSTTQAQENDTLDGVALEIPNDAKAGPGFDIDKATDAYINLLSEEDRARSDAYMEGGYWLQLWGALYGLGIAWLMLGTRLSVKMRDLSERLGRWP